MDRSFQDFESLPDLDTPEKICEEKDVDRQLREAYRALEGPYREVVILRLLNELKFKEIADIMENSENWAKVTFYRGKLKLRGFTGSDYEDIRLLNNMISLNFDKYGSIFDLNFEITAQKDGAEYWYKVQENSPYNLDVAYDGKMKREYNYIMLSAVMNALDKVQWKRIFGEGISPDYYSVRFIENPIRVEGGNTRILLFGGPDTVQYYVSKNGEVTEFKDASSIPAESHVVLIAVTPMYNDGNGSSGTGKFFYYVETE